MKHSARLADLLQSTFGLHRARVACLAALVIALFRVKTVNLAQLATAFPGTAEIGACNASANTSNSNPRAWSQFVLAFLPDAPYTLTLDRTQWMLGRVPINFLVLSVVHDGTAFPLFWRVPESSSGQALAKRGNSNTQERIELLGQFLTVVGGDKIDCLVADREFIGATWFAWLRANHIPLCIRTRHAGLADNRSLITGAQLLQKSSPFDLVFLDRPASRLRPLALGNRSALVLWGLFDRGVKSSGSSSPGDV